MFLDQPIQSLNLRVVQTCRRVAVSGLLKSLKDRGDLLEALDANRHPAGFMLEP